MLVYGLKVSAHWALIPQPKKIVMHRNVARWVWCAWRPLPLSTGVTCLPLITPSLFLTWRRSCLKGRSLSVGPRPPRPPEYHYLSCEIILCALFLCLVAAVSRHHIFFTGSWSHVSKDSDRGKNYRNSNLFRKILMTDKSFRLSVRTWLTQREVAFTLICVTILDTYVTMTI